MAKKYKELKIYEEIKNSEEYKACFNCSFYLVCMDRPFQLYLLPCFEWDEDMLHEIVNKKK